MPSTRMEVTKISAKGTGIEELLDAFALWRLQDEACVVIFVDAIGDFGIAVGICVGMFLAREAQDYTGVISAGRRKLVRVLPRSDF